MPLSKLNDPSLLQTGSYINGTWHENGKQFTVTDPGTGKPLAQVSNSGARETTLAIDAAEAALPSWRQQSARVRDTILRRWYDLILAASADLATLITAEGGKTLAEGTGEVAYAASFVEWFSEQARRVNGEILPSNTPDKRLLITREPVGVCAAITPWNFPAAMITRKVAPALAVGCTVVVKPAEQTPLTALALAVLAERAGIPPGVFNVVTGDAAAAAEIGSALTQDMRVRKLSFTGSTQVGRLLMAQSAPSLKRLSLELGGNDPLIILDDLSDSDLDKAAELAAAGATRNSGQRCTAVKRILVQERVADRFVEKVLARAKAIKFGDPMDPNTDLGTVVHELAAKTFEDRVHKAAEQGAKILYNPGRQGALLPPITVDFVPHQSELVFEETFGPIVPIVRVPNDDDEVIRISNSTPFGLSSGVCTNNLSRITKFIEGLNVGTVNIWEVPGYRIEMSPFGGIKDSGNGVKEGVMEAMKFFTNVKTWSLPWPQ